MDKDYVKKEFEVLVGDVIGKGRYGEVSCCRSVYNNKECVVKASRVDREEAIYESLRCEAKILQACRHENVVECFQWKEQKLRRDSIIYIMMEFCERGNLRKAIRERIFQEKYAWMWTIFRGILAGVGHIHSQNVLHRDLKPENIALTVDYVPKIIDFGIAREHSDQSMTPGHGTVTYDAPESRDLCYTSKVDIYSLGVILCEMLFSLDISDENIRDKVTTIFKKFKADPERFPGLGESLDASQKTIARQMVSKMLDDAPENRPSVAQMLDEDKVLGKVDFWHIQDVYKIALKQEKLSEIRLAEKQGMLLTSLRLWKTLIDLKVNLSDEELEQLLNACHHPLVYKGLLIPSKCQQMLEHYEEATRLLDAIVDTLDIHFMADCLGIYQTAELVRSVVDGTTFTVVRRNSLRKAKQVLSRWPLNHPKRLQILRDKIRFLEDRDQREEESGKLQLELDNLGATRVLPFGDGISNPTMPNRTSSCANLMRVKSETMACKVYARRKSEGDDTMSTEISDLYFAKRQLLRTAQGVDKFPLMQQELEKAREAGKRGAYMDRLEHWQTIVNTAIELNEKEQFELSAACQPLHNVRFLEETYNSSEIIEHSVLAVQTLDAYCRTRPCVLTKEFLKLLQLEFQNQLQIRKHGGYPDDKDLEAVYLERYQEIKNDYPRFVIVGSLISQFPDRKRQIKCLSELIGEVEKAKLTLPLLSRDDLLKRFKTDLMKYEAIRTLEKTSMTQRTERLRLWKKLVDSKIKLTSLEFDALLDDCRLPEYYDDELRSIHFIEEEQRLHSEAIVCLLNALVDLLSESLFSVDIERIDKLLILRFFNVCRLPSVEPDWIERLKEPTLLVVSKALSGHSFLNARKIQILRSWFDFLELSEQQRKVEEEKIINAIKKILIFAQTKKGDLPFLEEEVRTMQETMPGLSKQLEITLARQAFTDGNALVCLNHWKSIVESNASLTQSELTEIGRVCMTALMHVNLENVTVVFESCNLVVEILEEFLSKAKWLDEVQIRTCLLTISMSDTFLHTSHVGRFESMNEMTIAPGAKRRGKFPLVGPFYSPVDLKTLRCRGPFHLLSRSKAHRQCDYFLYPPVFKSQKKVKSRPRTEKF